MLMIHVFSRRLVVHIQNIVKTNRGRSEKRIGHIIRNNEWLTTVIIEGKLEGKAGRVDQELHLSNRS